MAKSRAYRWRGWRTSADQAPTAPYRKGKKKPKRKRQKTKGQKRAASGWWWTRTKFPGTCHGCGMEYGEGDVICFRSQPKTVYCQTCAEGEGVAAKAQLSKSMGGRVPPVARREPAPAPEEGDCEATYRDGKPCQLDPGHDGLHEHRNERGIYRWR